MPDSAKSSKKTSQIIGLRLSSALVREVKAEAGRRGVRLNQLFVELWDLYKNSKKGKKMNGS